MLAVVLTGHRVAQQSGTSGLEEAHRLRSGLTPSNIGKGWEIKMLHVKK